MPLKLFISYSHQDQTQLDKLLEGLRPLEREGLIAPRTDRLIDVGEDWQGQITTALEDCELGIFLISMPFLGSDFINAKELAPLLARAKSDDVRLVPVLLRHCDWTNTALGKLQPLPGWDQYIENSGDDEAARDSAWTLVVKKIRQWASESIEHQDEAEWHGSPYPGLRAFDECEAPIFMGRRAETEALLDKLEQGVRFVAVFGASGSGKSSLVLAGLIPAWRRRFAVDEQTPILIIKPDELGKPAGHNPFLPLSIALKPFLPPGSDVASLEQTLRTDPTMIGRSIDMALQGLATESEFFLVVDQFEELFTTVEPIHRQPFASMLGRVLAHSRARLVITVRSDFFHCFEDYPELAAWLNQGNGQFLVRPLEPEHYRTLIEAPARLAGFGFEDGLVDRMLADAREGGSREGLVPLLEFALAKLYQPFAEDGVSANSETRLFSNQTYQAFEGIKGAVSAAADEAVAEVENAAQALPRLFRALVAVSAEMKPTRRRATRAELERNPDCAHLIQRLIGDRDHARLLVATKEHVEVAHEILFDAWQAMADWIAEFKNDLHTRDRMILEASQWDQGGRSDPHLLWSHERQQPLYQSLQRLGQPRETWKTEPEKSFLHPERERLCDEIADPATDHQRRDWIGARWAAIGDPRPGLGLDLATGLPDILWSEEVPPGTVELDGDAGRIGVEQPFKVALYPVTREQYTAFLDDPEGYDSDAWWHELKRPEPRWPPTGAGGNYPVGLVTWHEAVAYCRWLDHRSRELGKLDERQQIRLPTEWEWQQAATGGVPGREYPWSGPWDPGKLNSVDGGLMRTVAAGLYPAGAAPCGALDMAGNSWEWCLNKYRDVEKITFDGDEERVLRGGSWIDLLDFCRAAFRRWYDPGIRNDSFGFRLCLSSPIGDR